MAKKSRIEVTCPCCNTVMKVDPATGLVLSSREMKSGYSLDEAIRKEEERKSRSDEIFSRAFQDEKQRRKSLEDKFQEALDSQDELEDPVRPMDLD